MRVSSSLGFNRLIQNLTNNHLDIIHFRQFSVYLDSVVQWITCCIFKAKGIGFQSQSEKQH